MFLKLEEMSLEQKLGMVLCARRFQENDVDYIIERVKNHALGCIQGYSQQPEILEKILAAADYPLLVINDTEAGFPTSDLPKIPLNALSACDDPKYIQAFARGIVSDAQKAGFNGTWGPVVDILECNGLCKVSRCFSDKKERVAELAEEIAKIYKQNHYLSCGKHFPGTSGISVDTHMEEGASQLSREYVEEINLYPYKYLLDKGLLPSVMIEHTVFDSIDPDYPASLSKKHVDLLRSTGFDGVLFTDSFAMMGVLQRFGEENIYGMAIAAGVDIVLPNYRTSVKDCFDKLRKNYEDGAFTEERLDEAVRRVLKAQEFVGTAPEHPTPFTEEDRKLLDEVAKKCITAVTDPDVSVALSEPEKERLFIVLPQNEKEETADAAEITIAPWYDSDRVAARIKENFPGATIAFIPEFSSARQHEDLLTQATYYKEVVVVTFCYNAAYLGTDGLTRRSESWINALQRSGKISAIVHFGNPFALENIIHIPRRIFGYIISDAQEYAIDALAGKFEPTGKMPFVIELQ